MSNGTPSSSAPAASRYARFSPGRIWTLAAATVTQLVRMKILAFVIVFCMIVVAMGFAFPVLNPEQQLKFLKDVSFGALQFFSVVIAIVATAVLMPRDLEDRTLYTILSKPVPRHEYLIGKLLGVLVLLACGLVIMDVVLSGVLYLRQNIVLGQALQAMEHEGAATPENIASVTASVAKQGLTWSLHVGVLAIFLKASVVAALALLISCFASTTLFTIVITFLFAIAGHGHQLFREYFLEGKTTVAMEKIGAAVLAIVCPDLGMFDVVDNVTKGDAPPVSDMLYLGGMALVYVTGYLVVSHLLFVEKEL